MIIKRLRILSNEELEEPIEYKEGGCAIVEELPSKTVEKFLDLWKHGEFEQMVIFTQLTWREKEKDPAIKLLSFFSSKKLLHYDILYSEKVKEPGLFIYKEFKEKGSVTDFDLDSDVCFDVHVNIFYMVKNEKYRARIKARVVREEKAFMPSVDGVWGINPVSMLRFK